MTIIDSGAPFEVNFTQLTGANWLAINRGKSGLIYIIPNGHAIGQTRVGRVVYLGKVDLENWKNHFKKRLTKEIHGNRLVQDLTSSKVIFRMCG